jgi:hypothetical protein
MSQKVDEPTTKTIILTRGVNNIFHLLHVFCPPLILEAVLEDVVLMVLGQNRVPSHADYSVNQSTTRSQFAQLDWAYMYKTAVPVT